MGFLIQPASEWVAGAQLCRSLWVLLAAVGFILLIASVNLTHLLLARATARRRETAIRAALGAGRGRLVRQFLAESLVLGLLGAGAGLLLAVGAIQLLKVFDPGDIPRLAEVTIDMPVLAFTLAVGLLSGVLAGLVPAFQVPYASLINVLRGGDRHFVAGKTERLMRSAFVSAEIALTLVLLVGAVLLTRSFGALLQVDRGFQSENRVFFTITLPPSYEGRSHSGDFIDEFLLHVNGVPESDGVGHGALEADRWSDARQYGHSGRAARCSGCDGVPGDTFGGLEDRHRRLFPCSRTSAFARPALHRVG